MDTSNINHASPSTTAEVTSLQKASLRGGGGGKLCVLVSGVTGVQQQNHYLLFLRTAGVLAPTTPQRLVSLNS